MSGRESDDAVFVVAEAGVNHNGSLDIAHDLIDAAADLGADAVKFQTFVPDLLVADDAPTAVYQRKSAAATTQAAMLEELTLPLSGWAELADHAAEAGVEFMSTCFDEPSLDHVIGLGVRRLKVPSGELTNLAFIERVAAAKLPVVLSTGMGTMTEVLRAVEAASASPEITVLHCVSAYPAPVAQANLSVIPRLREATGLAVGWSDHCVGTEAVAIAIALGATLVERHLTLDRLMPGPDHQASDDPRSFRDYLAVIATTRAAMGDGVKRPQPCELDVRKVARRSWHARHALNAGTTLRSGDLIALRPASGIGVDIDIVGRSTRTAVAAGAPLQEQDLDPAGTNRVP